MAAHQDERSDPQNPPGQGGISPARADGGQPGADPHDHDLIRQMLAGDQDAMRELVARYDRLIRYTIFKTGQRHCARDPGWLDARANEAWTGIVKSLRRSGKQKQPLPPNISAYFSQIARNKCLDARRTADARQVIPFDQSGEAAKALEQPDAAESDPAALLEGVEEMEALRECMAMLREEDQLICSEIALIVEKRWKEAAERLGIAESTLRSKWQGVIGRLKGCLEKKIEKKFAPPSRSTDS